MTPDPWAFGWTAVAALATSAAVIMAGLAWRVDAARARRENAALVTIHPWLEQVGKSDPIAETRIGESGRPEHFGDDGELLPRQSGVVQTREDGRSVCVFVRQVTEIKNGSSATVFDAIGTPLDTAGSEAMESTGGHPIYSRIIPPGTTQKFVEHEYAWIGNTGVRLNFRMQGAEWTVTSKGGFKKVRFGRVRAFRRRLASEQRRRQRQQRARRESRRSRQARY